MMAASDASNHAASPRQRPRGHDMRRHPTQRLAALAAAFVGLLALTASTANAAGVAPAFYPAAAAHAQITGSGSSWSANAVNQWIADFLND